jgi:hypothetical protein
MHAVWTICKREVNAFFDSLTAYVLLVVFLGLSGTFTWLFGQGDVFFVGEASLDTFFKSPSGPSSSSFPPSPWA